MTIKLHCPCCGNELQLPDPNDPNRQECQYCLKTIAVPAIQTPHDASRPQDDQILPVLYKSAIPQPKPDVAETEVVRTARKTKRKSSTATLPRMPAKPHLSHVSAAAIQRKKESSLMLMLSAGGALLLVLGVVLLSGNKTKVETESKKGENTEASKSIVVTSVPARETPVVLTLNAPVRTPPPVQDQPVASAPILEKVVPVEPAPVPASIPAKIETVEGPKPVAPEKSVAAVLDAPRKPNVIAEETEVVEATKPADKAPHTTDANPFLTPKEPAKLPVVKPDAPGKAAAPVAAAPVPVPVVCPDCTGTQFVPILPPTLYVRADGDPAGVPEKCVPWKPCPRCNKAFDPKMLVQTEADRLTRTEELRKKWEPLVGDKLSFAETSYVTVLGQAPVTFTKGIAGSLAKLTSYLQGSTHSTFLTPTRPDTHLLVITNSRNAWMKLCDAMAAQNPGMDVSLMKQANGSQSRKLCMNFSDLNRPVDAQHFAVFQYGKMLMEEATNGKSPPWLNEGFGAVCENQMFESNLCYSFAYEKNDVKFVPNWNREVRNYAMKGQLKPWDRIFPIALEGIKAADYLTCYSMVAFLMRNDPQRFVKFVELVREGGDVPQSIEKTYGMKIAELQVRWAQWALTQH